MPQKIYLADDEKNIRDLIAAFLSQEGFEVKTFESGDALLSACDIVICQDSVLSSDELAAVLEQLRTADELTAALPDSPELVCGQLEEFINRFQEGSDLDDE